MLHSYDVNLFFVCFLTFLIFVRHRYLPQSLPYLWLSVCPSVHLFVCHACGQRCTLWLHLHKKFPQYFRAFFRLFSHTISFLILTTKTSFLLFFLFFCIFCISVKMVQMVWTRKKINRCWWTRKINRKKKKIKINNQ